jgi:hypothetical protein
MGGRWSGGGLKPEETTMRPALHRVLAAYRPLYLNGLLRDGQYRLPKPAGTGPAGHAASARPPRRGLLVALASLLVHHRGRR